MIDGQGVDGKAAFQRGVLVKIVDDDLGDGVTLDLNDYPRVLVGLVPDRGDVGDDLLVDQRGDAFDEHGAVDVVRNFGDDNLLASTLELLEANFAADFDAAASAGEVL